MTGPIDTAYRAARRPVVDSWHDPVTRGGGVRLYQAGASAALWQARAERDLAVAEADDLVRFQWDWDADYAPESGEREWDQWEAQKLADGEYEALVCTLEYRAIVRPHTCPGCQCELVEEWVAGPALGGVVVDVNDRHGFRREVERELWAEHVAEVAS